MIHLLTTKGQTAPVLRNLLKAEGKKLSAAKFREFVHELRMQGHWICADNTGYYLASNEADKQKLIHSLKSRVKSINQVIERLCESTN